MVASQEEAVVSMCINHMFYAFPRKGQIVPSIGLVQSTLSNEMSFSQETRTKNLHICLCIWLSFNEKNFDWLTENVLCITT